MLIDGGGFHGGSFDVGRLVLAPYLWYRRFHRFETMVLSHAHPDHFRGLNFIARHFSVQQFWSNNLPGDHPDFSHLVEELAKKNVLCLGPQKLPPHQSIHGVDVQVLHPPPDFSPDPKITSPRELNNHSLVLRLNYRGVSFLFPGDIEKETEYRLVNLPLLEPVDVLLVPHHGSRTSSSLEFLHRLRPKIAVFSVGFGNPFRLPSSEVLERYRSLGVKIYRTDHHGAITISTDGEKIKVDTFITPQKAGKKL
jgi:competence protein ComEC